MGTVKDKFSEGLTSLGKSFTNGINSIIDTIKDIPQHLINLKDKIINGFTDVVDTVTSIPSKIIELLKELFNLLFIPTKTPVDDIKSKFNTKFPIVNQIKNFTSNLFTRYGDTSTAPAFTITFHGNTVDLLNLSWYSQYRGLVCGIISCVSWLFFIMWLLKFIPKMLGGVN